MNKTEYLAYLADLDYIQEVGTETLETDLSDDINLNIYQVRLLHVNAELTQAIWVWHNFAVYREGQGGERGFSYDGAELPYFIDAGDFYKSIKNYIIQQDDIYDAKNIELSEVDKVAQWIVYKHVTDHIEEKLWRFYGSTGYHKKALTRYGDSTTEINIDEPQADTFRYLWNGNGTDPNFAASGVVVNQELHINVPNFNDANNGVFKVLAVTDNYFAVSNPDGVAEENKAIGAGYIRNNIEHEEILDVNGFISQVHITDADGTLADATRAINETLVALENTGITEDS